MQDGNCRPADSAVHRGPLIRWAQKRCLEIYFQREKVAFGLFWFFFLLLDNSVRPLRPCVLNIEFRRGSRGREGAWATHAVICKEGRDKFLSFGHCLCVRTCVCLWTRWSERYLQTLWTNLDQIFRVDRLWTKTNWLDIDHPNNGWGWKVNFWHLYMCSQSDQIWQNNPPKGRKVSHAWSTIPTTCKWCGPQRFDFSHVPTPKAFSHCLMQNYQIWHDKHAMMETEDSVEFEYPPTHTRDHSKVAGCSVVIGDMRCNECPSINARAMILTTGFRNVKTNFTVTQGHQQRFQSVNTSGKFQLWRTVLQNS